MADKTAKTGEFWRGYEQCMYDLGAVLGHHDLGLGKEMPPAEWFPSAATLRGYIAGLHYRAYTNGTLREGEDEGDISTKERIEVEQAFNRLFEQSIRLEESGGFMSRVARSDEDYDELDFDEDENTDAAGGGRE